MAKRKSMHLYRCVSRQPMLAQFLSFFFFAD